MQNQTSRKREEIYEEWDKEKSIRYKVELRVKGGRIVYVKTSRRIYPLRNYGNYEELVAELTFLRKNIRVEIYYLRNSWNGTGYYPVCNEKMPSDNINIDMRGNVKRTVLDIFGVIAHYLENMEKCPNAVEALSPS